MNLAKIKNIKIYFNQNDKKNEKICQNEKH